MLKALIESGKFKKDITGIIHFPATRRELLDMLQVRLAVFMDRVEVKAVFPIEPIECQAYPPDCRSQQLIVKLLISIS